MDRSEGFFEDRQRAPIDRFAFVIPAQAVKNGGIRGSVRHRSWIGFSQQLLRNFPGFFSKGFRSGEIAFREENAPHVVINRASGEALFPLCGSSYSQGLLVEPEPFVEAAAVLVEYGEVIQSLGVFVRCL